MKRLIAVLLVAVLMVTFLVGCGKKRELYKKVKLENYVEVGNYLGVEVDTTTEEFAQIFDYVFYNIDVIDNELYKEGVVANGDIIILDYEGKIDGVAFSGGTAEDAVLEIGSGTFIDDFEQELIGVAVGETKDVTAKFPEDYGVDSLNGKEAIFTCKVKGIYMTVEEAYDKMDFKSVDEYKADIKERAVKQYILSEVVENSKIKDYPNKDSELLCNAMFEWYVETYKNEYNLDFEKALIENGSSAETFKSENLAVDAVPQMMNVNMVMYYILDTEELELLESTVNSQGMNQPALAESYAVQDIVLEYLYDNAVIK